MDINGETVIYGNASSLYATLEYDLNKEKNFSYKNLTINEIVHHLAIFVANLWQIHIFGEGNTRTTAVFFIKYLKTLGFNVTNDIFAENSWYFRNALVRANYNDVKNGIYKTTEFLEIFLRNLLLNEKNELKNRTMLITFISNEPSKANIETKKANIEMSVSNKTLNYITALYKEFDTEGIFGRSNVEMITGLKSKRAYELIVLMLENCVIEPVIGHGKGKYHFVK